MFPNAQRMNRGGQVGLLLGILFLFDTLMHYKLLIRYGIWSLQLERFIILESELLSLTSCRIRKRCSIRLNYNLNMCICTVLCLT